MVRDFGETLNLFDLKDYIIDTQDLIESLKQDEVLNDIDISFKQAHFLLRRISIAEIHHICDCCRRAYYNDSDDDDFVSDDD